MPDALEKICCSAARLGVAGIARGLQIRDGRVADRIQGLRCRFTFGKLWTAKLFDELRNVARRDIRIFGSDGRAQKAQCRNGRNGLSWHRMTSGPNRGGRVKVQNRSAIECGRAPVRERVEGRYF